MNFFELLRAHARELPDQTATASPRHRLTSYRKLWSRIERASARLQGEWMVEPGDVLMYAGNAHADALVLWLAAARLSALLLPLESPALRAAAPALAQRHGVHVLLHDDDLPSPLPDEECASYPLSSIVARPAEYVAQGPEKDSAPSLLFLPEPGAPEVRLCLAQLLQGHGQDAAGSGPGLLAPQRLALSILPALRAGRPLHLD